MSGFWSPMMQQVIDWAYRNGIKESLAPSEFGRQVNEKLGVNAPLNVYPDESAKVWLEAIAKRDGPHA